jgi:hypothetical protein
MTIVGTGLRCDARQIGSISMMNVQRVLGAPKAPMNHTRPVQLHVLTRISEAIRLEDRRVVMSIIDPIAKSHHPKEGGVMRSVFKTKRLSNTRKREYVQML